MTGKKKDNFFLHPYNNFLKVSSIIGYIRFSNIHYINYCKSKYVLETRYKVQIGFMNCKKNNIKNNVSYISLGLQNFCLTRVTGITDRMLLGVGAKIECTMSYDAREQRGY